MTTDKDNDFIPFLAIGLFIFSGGIMRHLIFTLAYGYCAGRGYADGVGGMEYQRVLKEWESMGKPIFKVITFIKRRANVPPRLIPFSKEVLKPNQDCGETYLHCGLCMDSKPAAQSPKEFARLNVAYTRSGIQIWCTRHEVNVIHIDFMNNKMPADRTRNSSFKSETK